MDKGQAKMPKRNKTVARKFAFIMDPLERVLVDKDTTFVFMLEAQLRGHEVYFLGIRDLYARGPQAIARARQCEVMRAESALPISRRGRRVSARDFRCGLHAQGSARRCAYLYATMLLSLADTRRTFVLNHPAGCATRTKSSTR